MEPARYLGMLRRWWWLLVLAVATGAVAAYVASTYVTPRYEARATLLIVDQETPGVSRRQDLETSAALANTFAELITLRPLLAEVQARGGFELTTGELRRAISVSQETDTQFLRVTARASDPVLARDIANALAEAFIASPQVRLTSREANVTLVEAAEAPGAPAWPRPLLSAVLGGALALLAALGIVLAVAYLDDTVKTPEQVLAVTGLPALGRIDRFDRGQRRGGLAATVREGTPSAEAFSALRTSLGYVLDSAPAGRGRIVLLTSPGLGEGKSSTTANLAVSFGLAGQQVAVVDADLRRPVQHALLSLDAHVGLTTWVLSEELALERVARATAYAGVVLVAAGPRPPRPAELLSSPRVEALLTALQQHFDVVLVDTPPVLGVTDATVLARFADEIVVVAQAGRTRTSELRGAIEELARVGRPIAGVVLNRDRRSGRQRYYAPERGRRTAEAATVEAPVQRELPRRS